MMMISVWRNMREEAQKKHEKTEKTSVEIWCDHILMWKIIDHEPKKNERQEYWNRNENKTNKKMWQRLFEFKNA